MKKFLIRCSSLSSVMPDPVSYPRDEMNEAELEALASKKRTPAQVQMLSNVMARTLSEGAKEHVHKMVKRYLFDYPEPELGSKEVRKGIMQENAAISLLSAVTGELYTKNETRFSECTVSNSSWHGTGVASVVGAATNNGRDLAGIDWNARIQPVRALGKCGGMSSEAMRRRAGRGRFGCLRATAKTNK